MRKSTRHFTRGLSAVAVTLGAAACGDNRVAPPDAADSVAQQCTATFSGNFAEASTRVTNCAAVSTAATSTTLAFAIASDQIGATFAISVDLGRTPAAGDYSSDSVTSWSASALQDVAMSSCLYSAGGSAVPSGSFALSLTSLAATTAHGHIELQLYVLARPFTDCGDATTESLSIEF
ncbi:MAG TPA: hypothetical protein VGM88_01930 [Kofleriaceae bacterium]|jgi:hypothetical protein